MEAVLKKEEEAAATRASPGFPRPLLFGDAPPRGEGTGGTLHHMGGCWGGLGAQRARLQLPCKARLRRLAVLKGRLRAKLHPVCFWGDEPRGTIAALLSRSIWALGRALVISTHFSGSFCWHREAMWATS